MSGFLHRMYTGLTARFPSAKRIQASFIPSDRILSDSATGIFFCKVSNQLYCWKQKADSVCLKEGTTMKEKRPLIIFVHGITEHTGRYRNFKNYMQSNRIDTILYDIKGFGARKNEPDKSWSGDVDELVSLAEANGKDKETYIIGFSLGSFIVRCAMDRLQDPNYHFILIGTGQPDLWSLKFASLLMNREVKKNGYYTPTKLTQKLLFDNYNKKFKDADNSIEWLLKDKNAQQEYLQDENILSDVPCGYFKDMLDGMILAQKVPDSRKIVNISGTEDPVGNFSRDMEKLRKQYPNIINMPVSGGRHDVLHDTCRSSVLKLITQSIREWTENGYKS